MSKLDNGYEHTVLACWSSGMILALGATKQSVYKQT